MVRSDPVSGVLVDFPKYQDEIFNASKEALKSLNDDVKDLLERAKSIDQTNLTDDELSDLSFVIASAEASLIDLKHYAYEIPSSHLVGCIVGMHMGLPMYQKLDTLEDITNYRTRLEKFSVRFEDAVNGYKAGIKSGITLPEHSIKLLIDVCNGQIDKDPRESPFNKKEKALELTGDEEFLVPAIEYSVVPAYRRLRTFLREEYLGNARPHAGIYGLPNAEEAYSDLIYRHTSVRYTASELHDLGWQEVIRIKSRMESLRSQIYPHGTLTDLMSNLKDPQKFPDLFFKTTEEVIPAYEAMLARIDERMPRLFRDFPRKRLCDIVAYPDYAESSAPLAAYEPGTAERPGVFRVNMALQKSSATTSMMALTLHEACPGHHHQFTLSNEMPDTHPMANLCWSTAFVEGWGLYSEYLGEEMGMYDDPWQLFGRLELEMHRALRLIVDTGLHAKGWSISKCISLMSEYESMPHDKLESEVRRYAVFPGQALAYKVGELKILELRRFAEKQLGDRFDIRGFHAALLDHGAVPLSVAEKFVRKWVDEMRGLVGKGIRKVQDKFVDLVVRMEPVIGPLVDHDKYPTEIFDSSREAFERHRAELIELKSFVDDLLEKVNKGEPATESEMDELVFLQQVLEKSVVSSTEENWMLEVSHLNGDIAAIQMLLMSYQPLETKRDISNYRTRLSLFPSRFAQVIDRLRAGIAAGLTQPKESIEQLILLCSNNIGPNSSSLKKRVDMNDPYEVARVSPYNKKEESRRLTGDEDYLVPVICEKVIPAYQALKEFLEAEYLPRARLYPGLYGLPNDRELYETQLFAQTSVKCNAEDLHQLGLREVSRIAAEMEFVKDQILKSRNMSSMSLRDFLWVITDRTQFPELFLPPQDDGSDSDSLQSAKGKKKEVLVEKYEELLEKIDSVMPKFFEEFPKKQPRICGVQTVPKEMEDAFPLAYYQPGSENKPGVFSVNMKLFRNAPIHKMTALALHEGLPGHHHQIAMSFEAEERHPIHKIASTTATVEGWGLYSEYLGKEMGMYSDPFQYFGRLELEMHRALRLVIDTGLHTKGWSIPYAVDTLSQYSSMSPSEMENEIKRYAVSPGQACCYKVGELKILELRKLAEEELGGRFDVRKFHSVVLDASDKPLMALEKAVTRWIEAEKKVVRTAVEEASPSAPAAAKKAEEAGKPTPSDIDRAFVQNTSIAIQTTETLTQPPAQPTGPSPVVPDVGIEFKSVEVQVTLTQQSTRSIQKKKQPGGICGCTIS
ncbi:hypothetical protein HK102_004225 [Quaeritorhiza haematococci]|nr:hypothetical protein HK102_004225 [Quaeritorhiza haematococci]